MCSHALSTLNCVGAGARFKCWEWSVGSVGSVVGWRTIPSLPGVRPTACRESRARYALEGCPLGAVRVRVRVRVRATVRGWQA